MLLLHTLSRPTSQSGRGNNSVNKLTWILPQLYRLPVQHPHTLTLKNTHPILSTECTLQAVWVWAGDRWWAHLLPSGCWERGRHGGLDLPAQQCHSHGGGGNRCWYVLLSGYCAIMWLLCGYVLLCGSHAVLWVLFVVRFIVWSLTCILPHTHIHTGMGTLSSFYLKETLKDTKKIDISPKMLEVGVVCE